MSKAEYHTNLAHHNTSELKANSTLEPISRRGLMAGLLATAGGISARNMIGAPQTVPLTCTIDPDFASLVQEEQLNNTNQSLVIIPGKGLVATFGNSVYRFDSASNSFALCRNGNVIIRGSVTMRSDDRRDVLIEEVESVGATTGARAIRLFHTFEVIDGLRVQISLDAGVPGQDATFWFSTVFDARTGIFPNGFMVKGDAPFFDFSPLRTLGRLIRGRFGGLFLFGSSQPPIVAMVSPEECDRTCLDWKAVCTLSFESGVYDNTCGILAVSCINCTIRSVPRFLNPKSF